MTEKEKTSLKNKLKDTGDKLFEQTIEKLKKYRKDEFVNPIINIVAVLPKDELAAMAESLVNLTLLKRRISFDSETVGGPIDVAVISKGDGFIWIKRKHYFSPELNQRYISNYYREAKYGKEK